MLPRRNIAYVIAVLAVLALGASAPSAAAQDDPPPTSGSVLGNPGGAAVAWPVTFPASTNVVLTLTHDPCNTEAAVVLEAYGPHGFIGKSGERDACTQELTFNTVGGGAGTIKMLNYLDGVMVSYVLSAEGVVLPESEAEPEAPEPPAGDDGTVSSTTTGITDSLVGNAGGAFKTYTLEAQAGETYELVLDYAMASGGSSWSGVGVNVWAPDDALLASSTESSPSSHNVSFTPSSEMNLMVQVFNYNPNETMNFVLQGLPGGLEN
jgi:hypothetical protein